MIVKQADRYEFKRLETEQALRDMLARSLRQWRRSEPVMARLVWNSRREQIRAIKRDLNTNLFS